MSTISLKDVCLKYKIEFKEDGKLVPEDFWVLKNININIDKGEVVGIIGENGAGKTTVLKIIASMLKPDKGVVEVNGAVSALMEIGAGFQKDSTGRENIYLVSSLFGLTKDEIDKRYDNIVNFAELGRFINAPIKIYSGGMFMRLAFAIAIYVDTDILIVDDIFAVGDIYAQRKCINKMFELKEKGKTIVLVSHDMEMVKRLCSRGIFIREGMVIKDGPINDVYSYYIETVGNKKGIVIVQKGSLAVVFNNGKTVLRWKDNALTYNLAGHSILFSSGREFLSTTADWEIQESKTGDSIMAIGKWIDFPVSQYVKITFVNEKEFLYEIMMEIHKPILLEKYETRIIFTDGYKSWFTLNNEIDFPENFVHEKEWECILINDSVNRMVGLRGSSDAVASLPTVVFDTLCDNIKMTCQAGNTGSEIGGRVVHYKIFPKNLNVNYSEGKYRWFLSKIKIFEREDEKELISYINYTKEIIYKDLLSISCNDHKIEMYWQNKLVTNGIGLNTKFSCQDKDYNALDGYWVIYKKTSEEIIITINWDDKLPFNQIWRLKLEDANTILWEIEMEIKERIKIKNKETEIFLSENYERWVTAEEAGDFKLLEKRGNAVVLDRYINKCIGVEGFEKKDLVLPSVFFENEDTASKVSYIRKVKEKNSFPINLQYMDIDFEENIYILPGRQTYFKGRIKINDNFEKSELIEISKKKLINANQDTLLNKIEFNKLALVFDNGKGKLFWDGVEFTKGLGLYSSFLFKDRWRDSSQAFWKIQKTDKNSLIAIGHWADASLTQTWNISILNDDIIALKILRKAWDNALLDKEQINLMLSDKYKEWFAHEGVYGKFPEKFNKHDGISWDRLWHGDTKAPIGVKKCTFKNNILEKHFLPSIILSALADSKPCCLIIENTDDLFRARILQSELNSYQNYSNSFDENEYFEWSIKIIN